MPDPINRQRAAGRGALVAALGASALLALLAAVKTTQYAHGVFALADALFDPKAFQAGPARVVAAVLAASAVVGAGVALIARRVIAPAWTRAVLLSLVSFPALYVLVALALTLIWWPNAAREDLTAVALVPVASLLYAAFGMVMVAPVAALPAVLAAVMLEGWTRPEDGAISAVGLGHPAVRRWVMYVVIAVTVVLATFATLRWPRS
jgi:hypothetical protein